MYRKFILYPGKGESPKSSAKDDIAMKMIDFSEMIIKSIYKESEASIGTEMLANLEIIRAVIFETLSGHTEMRECVEKAVEIARKFDETPVYDISTGASLWLSKVTEEAYGCLLPNQP